MLVYRRVPSFSPGYEQMAQPTIRWMVKSQPNFGPRPGCITSTCCAWAPAASVLALGPFFKAPRSPRGPGRQLEEVIAPVITHISWETPPITTTLTWHIHFELEVWVSKYVTYHDLGGYSMQIRLEPESQWCLKKLLPELFIQDFLWETTIPYCPFVWEGPKCLWPFRSSVNRGTFYFGPSCHLNSRWAKNQLGWSQFASKWNWASPFSKLKNGFGSIFSFFRRGWWMS